MLKYSNHCNPLSYFSLNFSLTQAPAFRCRFSATSCWFLPISFCIILYTPLTLWSLKYAPTTPSYTFLFWLLLSALLRSAETCIIPTPTPYYSEISYSIVSVSALYSAVNLCACRLQTKDYSSHFVALAQNACTWSTINILFTVRCVTFTFSAQRLLTCRKMSLVRQTGSFGRSQPSSHFYLYTSAYSNSFWAYMASISHEEASHHKKAIVLSPLSG